MPLHVNNNNNKTRSTTAKIKQGIITQDKEEQQQQETTTISIRVNSKQQQQQQTSSSTSSSLFWISLQQMRICGPPARQKNVSMIRMISFTFLFIGVMTSLRQIRNGTRLIPRTTSASRSIDEIYAESSYYHHDDAPAAADHQQHHQQQQEEEEEEFVIDIPRRNETGLIIVFIHVPKTGGTSIRRPIQLHTTNTKIYFVWGQAKYIQYTTAVTNIIDNWNQHNMKYHNRRKLVKKKTPGSTSSKSPWKVNDEGDGQIVYFELHTGDATPYIEFIPLLKEWRHKAHSKGIPFFAFTILRDSIDFAFSYYNYYHKLGNMKEFEQKFSLYSSEQTRLQEEQFFNNVIMSNPQCLFLSRTEDAYRMNEKCTSRTCGIPLRRGFDQTECNIIYQSFQNDLDWVGTTEKMSFETLPLLSTVITGKPNNLYKVNLGANSSTNKTSSTVVSTTTTTTTRENLASDNMQGKTKVFRMDEVSTSTIQHIHNVTQWDQNMYYNAIKDYPITIWKQNWSSS